jgi:hypothetical protein
MEFILCRSPLLSSPLFNKLITESVVKLLAGQERFNLHSHPTLKVYAKRFEEYFWSNGPHQAKRLAHSRV